MNAPTTRRAALAALASLPALAVLPAVAMASTTQLAALIEARRAAWAAFGVTVTALEAAEPDKAIVIPGVGASWYPVKSHQYEDLKNHIEDDFADEIEKTTTISALSPTLAEQARTLLEARRAFCFDHLDEVFADYKVAKAAWDEANDAEEVAMMAVCSYRCSSIEEVAIKVRYLVGVDEITELQRDAFLASFLPEGEEFEAFF
jgi:nitrogen fixation-related uncharacterized protein